MKKVAGLLSSAVLFLAVPSAAWAAAGAATAGGAAYGTDGRCDRLVGGIALGVPCWINWNHRAGSDW